MGTVYRVYYQSEQVEYIYIYLKMTGEWSVYWYYNYNFNKCMQRGNSVTLYSQMAVLPETFHTPNGTGLENETNETKRMASERALITYF